MTKEVAPGTQAKAVQNEMAIDLTLAFKLFGDDALKLVSKAEKDGWTIQQLEQELMRI